MPLSVLMATLRVTPIRGRETQIAGSGEAWRLHLIVVGIDVAHRDARLAIGGMPDGRLLIAVTRFDGAGGAFDFVPFGLSTPEMAAVMGGPGARDAVMLDGGISSQLLIREPGTVRRWPGLKKVPLALVVRARPA